MRAQHADDLLHRFDSRTHRLPTPVIEKLAGPSWGIFGGNLRADHLNSGRLPPDVPAESKKFRASRALLRRYSNTSPCHSFVPLLLTRIIWLPIAIPYSALKALVTTLYLRIPSTPSVVPASEAVDAPCSFTINAPSRVKLFDRIGAPLALNQLSGEPPRQWRTQAAGRRRAQKMTSSPRRTRDPTRRSRFLVGECALRQEDCNFSSKGRALRREDCILSSKDEHSDKKMAFSRRRMRAPTRRLQLLVDGRFLGTHGRPV